MTGLTDRQLEVLRFIARQIEENGYPPTIREIGEALDIRSTNGVNDHLKALERKGFLSRDPVKSRALIPTAAFRYYQAWPLIIRGWAMAASGEAAEGVAMIEKGMDNLRLVQSRLREPYYLGLLAHACIAAGQTDEAMKHVQDAFAVIEKGGETWAEAEIHRILVGETNALRRKMAKAISDAGY